MLADLDEHRDTIGRLNIHLKLHKTMHTDCDSKIERRTKITMSPAGIDLDNAQDQVEAEQKTLKPMKTTRVHKNIWKN